MLNALVGTLNAAVKPQAGGFGWDGTIEPRPGPIDVAEILKGQLDLTFVTKDVRYKDAQPEANLTPTALGGNILGGQALSGVTPLPGVGGLLGQLTGAVPLLSQSKVPVSLDVTWTVLDAQGQPLARDKWNPTKGELFDDAGTPKLRGTDISVAFRPVVQELTTTAPVSAPVQCTLRAEVKLKALTFEAARALPDIPVLVPTLGIPKVLAAFIHDQFQPKAGDDDGGVFIMVPGNSPLRSIEQLKSTLATLQTAATTLKSFAEFATFLLGLDTLVGSVTASPYFAFAASDAIQDLNEITLIQNDWFTNDIELEDELSSMIFVGPDGKVADCFCETDFEDDNGHFKLRVGPQFVTLVRSLHSKTPATEPGGMIEILKPPTHMIRDVTFNDWLSSLKFL
ncbi:hypothetical protein [Streptomyces swartbergensis]|uniref:hypothetical protein n=1 Tax=Streptomyces swartbergensis TaxID=487165 RepID=UPI0037FF1944